ncbi:S8 family peptidase [Streptomyces olivochromogenes]|uniref:S8 family peptidase n=1 Tax=Streptomyces olivochromogenes TaxID=1963 RepID=UPI0036DB5163
MSDTPHDAHGGQAPELRNRPRQYLVAPLPERLLPAGFTPVESGILFDQLQQDPEVNMHGCIVPAAHPSLEGAPQFPEVAVVEMPSHRAAAMDRDPQLHIEPNHHLRVASPYPVADSQAATRPHAGDAVRRRSNPGVQLAAAQPTEVPFVVSASDGGPLADAMIVVLSDERNFQATTGPDGRAVVTLTMHDPSMVNGVYVKPASDYWERWIARPDLSTDSDNVIILHPLSETFRGLPQRQVSGWGLSAMGLDRIPPTYRGQGIKIAIIDSGAATSHPELRDRVTAGINLVGDDATQWSVDVIGHGTHCAGVIGAADNGIGMLGIAVEAELHACEIFPRGQYSDIIKALDYCIQNEIDVVNLSLGGDQPSAFVAQKIEQARQAGIACIVAAGNSGGPVTFPGQLPSVLTVAAIGRLGQFPPDTYHATQVWGQPDAQGYFSAVFSSHGPEVDVCAPGVAILSTVPDRNYAVWDGTSMAAPHVTALAALVLAHHPDFRDGYSRRDANRVDRLFQLIRASCTPLDFGDPGRTGAGLPDAMRALGLVASPETAATPELAQLREAMRMAGLLPTAPGATADPLEQLRQLLRAAGLLPTP